MNLFQTISRRLTQWLIDGGAIKAEEREVYDYGLEKLFPLALCIIVTVALGLVCGIAAEMVAFYLCYYVVRIFAGGYHAKTLGRCLIISAVILLFPCIAILYCGQWAATGLFWTVWAVNLVILFLLAPVDSPNKRLDAKAKIVLGGVIKVCLLVVLGLSWASYHWLSLRLAVGIQCGVTLSAAMVVVGYIQNKLAVVRTVQNT